MPDRYALIACPGCDYRRYVPPGTTLYTYSRDGACLWHNLSFPGVVAAP